MAISPVGALPPVRTSLPVQSAIQPIQPATAPAPLAPAVKVDIQGRERDFGERSASTSADEKAAQVEQNTQRIRIDRDTKAIVYQVVDPNSGDVVVQLPDATVLKARAYADAAAAKLEKGERPFEKSA